MTVGGRQDPDGWRWKIDPALRMGGFGPWRPEWAMARLPGLTMPLLAVLGLQPETMGWGTQPEDVEPHLPPGGRLGSGGHRPLRPHRAARAGRRPGPRLPGSAAMTHSRGTVTVRHNRIELALHRLRDGDGGDRPLLYLHGLGEHARRPPCPSTSAGLARAGLGARLHRARRLEPCRSAAATPASCSWPTSTPPWPTSARPRSTGGGSGGYVALLTAGARPDLVRGAILDDGPGLKRRGPEPTTPSFVLTEPLVQTPGPPDPYALLELSHDVRPADYATTYARLAATLSGLDVALAVSRRCGRRGWRPWRPSPASARSIAGRWPFAATSPSRRRAPDQASRAPRTGRARPARRGPGR